MSPPIIKPQGRLLAVPTPFDLPLITSTLGPPHSGTRSPADLLSRKVIRMDNLRCGAYLITTLWVRPPHAMLRFISGTWASNTCSRVVSPLGPITPEVRAGICHLVQVRGRAIKTFCHLRSGKKSWQTPTPVLLRIQIQRMTAIAQP